MPINIRSDGAFQLLVRVGTAGQAPALTSREKQYLMVSSQPYLLLSHGTACLSGIEYIGANLGPPVTT